MWSQVRLLSGCSLAPLTAKRREKEPDTKELPSAEGKQAAGRDCVRRAAPRRLVMGETVAAGLGLRVELV